MIDEWTDDLMASLASEGITLHSLAVGGRDGLVHQKYWWPYQPELAQSTHSVTKSFTSLAVGLAVESGLLSYGSTVGELLGSRYDIGGSLGNATIEDLLTMRSGHSQSLGGDKLRLQSDSWVSSYLALDVPLEPGRRFLYSSATTHLLSAIVQIVSGRSVADLLDERVFRPLEFKRHSWESDPEGITSGGNGLNLRLQDLWKWGWLLLHDGVWGDDRVLPVGWVARATRPAVELSAEDGKGFATGYGHQIWCAPQGIYFASGIFGQNCFVAPRSGTVVAYTAGLSSADHARLQRLFINALQSMPIAAAPPSRMTEKPVFAPMSLEAAPPIPAWSHDLPNQGEWDCGPNPMGFRRIELAADPENVIVTLHEEGRSHSVKCGKRDWTPGVSSMPFWFLHHSYQPERTTILASACLASEDEIRLDWAFPETPFHDVVRVRFESDGGLLWTHNTNANSSANEYQIHCRPSAVIAAQ